MQGSVKRWGNSAAVRIPASVLASTGLRIDQAVDVRNEGGRIVIEAVQPPRYDLDLLVSAITDENRHEPIDGGQPVGKEAW